MKKTSFIIILMTIFINTTFSQKLKYGLYLGMNAYDIEIEGPYAASGGHSYINFGLFGDYQLSNRFGVKANIFYNKTRESNYDRYTGTYTSDLFGDVKYSSLQLQGLLKYDVRRDYNKGFYLLGGARLTNISKVTFEENREFEDQLLNKTNLGAVLGFGTSITRYINFELMADKSISNPFNLTDAKSSNVGVYGNINVNLSSFFSKK